MLEVDSIIQLVCQLKEIFSIIFAAIDASYPTI